MPVEIDVTCHHLDGAGAYVTARVTQIAQWLCIIIWLVTVVSQTVSTLGKVLAGSETRVGS